MSWSIRLEGITGVEHRVTLVYMIMFVEKTKTGRAWEAAYASIASVEPF